MPASPDLALALAVREKRRRVMALSLPDAETAADDPAGWMESVLGADLWEKQIEVAESVRDHRRTAVKSCHGAGKSWIAARTALWFLHTHVPSVVITTAPTGVQVKNILWREINRAAARSRIPLPGRVLQQRYDIGPDWYALGFKASDYNANAFQGFHADHILVIADEAAGISESVAQSLDNLLTSENARQLLIGNPTSVDGMFYDAFHRSRGRFHVITIAAADTPNIKANATIRPYLITQTYIDEAVETHGADSAWVTARVHAQFSASGTNTLIPLALVEAACVRDDLSTGDVEAGLDVARFGNDENALCVRQGERILEEHHWTGLDTMETVGMVRSLLEADYLDSLRSIKVDVVGLGAGVADRLREVGYPVVDVIAGATPNDTEAFINLRCELWWQLRMRFMEGRIGGAIDEVTMGQLASVRYKYDSRHTRPVIEPKEQAKKRGQVSPDRAEAVLLAFAEIEDPRLPGLFLGGPVKGWSP